MSTLRVVPPRHSALFLCALAVGCNGPAPGPDSGVDAVVPGPVAGPCDGTVCVAGAFDGGLVTFRAGWWAPFRSGTRWSFTGGFTNTDIDVCDYLMRDESIPSPLGFGFFVWDNELDANADALPDPGDYPVIPGWEGDHAEPRGAQGIVAIVGGAESTGQAGAFVIREIGETVLSIAVDLELEDGGRIVGDVMGLQRCDWLQ